MFAVGEVGQLVFPVVSWGMEGASIPARLIRSFYAEVQRSCDPFQQSVMPPPRTPAPPQCHWGPSEEVGDLLHREVVSTLRPPVPQPAPQLTHPP